MVEQTERNDGDQCNSYCNNDSYEFDESLDQWQEFLQDDEIYEMIVDNVSLL